MLLQTVGDALAAGCAIGALLLGVNGAGYLLMCAWAAMALLGMSALTAVTQDVVEPAVRSFSYGMAAFCQYVLGGAWGPIAVGAISDSLGGGAEGLRNAIRERKLEILDALTDDRRHCATCMSLNGKRCRARRVVVIDDLPRRCFDYRPHVDDPDQRLGSDRWPSMRPEGA